MTRAHNFCAGPCVLPESVLAEIGSEMVEYGSSGMSVIEMSHRSADYEAIHHDAIERLRRLSGAPDEFEILLLQGGATLQFAMIPQNIVPAGQRAGYVMSGSWATKAYADAALITDAYQAWAPTDDGPARMPRPGEVTIEADTAYLHVTTNETIGGIRMPELAGFGAPLVADMSSEYLARPIDWSHYDVVYGGAQKNLGPAGLAIVFIRRPLLERTGDHVPSYLRYPVHAAADSLANTPPTFPIWAMSKVLAWVEELGGVPAMEKRAAERSGLVYDAIERSGGFYRSPVDAACRSHTNVVFRAGTEEQEKAFLAEAETNQLLNLKGHRSVGGIRASIYNGLPTESVETLVAFMADFAARQG
ncbi:MAG: 3-phosphoserine/phosphohydroxythreonine transaminase [Actinomycetota bacterium]